MEESRRDSAALQQALIEGIDRVLTLARTWLAWDGSARVSEHGDRVYTPNKAIRRHTDHLIDHLAQVEGLLGRVTPEPDRWHGSQVTLAADWAPFTEADLNEAEQRLRRLVGLFTARLGELDDRELDRARESSWTIREIVSHVAKPWYAEQIGDLSRRGDHTSYLAASGPKGE